MTTVEPDEPELAGAIRPRPLQVLLVEDDDGDALLVEEYLAEFSEPVRLHRATTVRAAVDRLPGMDCVLLDLGLPDAQDLDGLRELEQRGQAAIVVLTGDAEAGRGRRAVGAGAQDYLVKDQIDGRLLGRTVRYAVERHRAERIAHQLREAKLHERENQRLERGLLPSALLGDEPALLVSSRYEPGHEQLLLGGDFFDAVRTSDGRVHLIIGDVCGHGPDEAAVGVCLRIAWRALILAGLPPAHALTVLQQVLVTERPSPELFATVCVVSVAPARDELSVILAGHPAPVLVTDGQVRTVDESRRGVPLGVLPDATWEAVDVSVPAGWAVLLYTDGLIEGRNEAGELLWPEGLVELLRRHVERAPGGWATEPAAALTTLVDAIKLDRPRRTDDLAAVLVTHRAGPG